jgi:RNA polymerase sigma-70 factor (ECF subfamily)
LPHLDSAYNLARWLAKNEDDAADITQEAMIKAFKNLGQVNAGSPKAWLMSIVRNTGVTFLTKKNGHQSVFIDEIEGLEWHGQSPEQALLMSEEKEVVMRLLEELPLEFREVVILRDLEDLSYKEISEVVGIPIGTVMSRLNRARQRLLQRLSDRTPEEKKLGL